MRIYRNADWDPPDFGLRIADFAGVSLPDEITNYHWRYTPSAGQSAIRNPKSAIVINPQSAIYTHDSTQE
jgi:hypothetical protein